MKIFVTSDLHIGHEKDFIYKARGFNNIIEHDNTIINRWNDTVDNNDEVYVLGDIIMGDKEYGLSRIKDLHGIIHWVYGNHDTENKIELLKPYIKNTLGYAYLLKYKNFCIYMSHYPTITSNYDDKRFKQHILNFHGHTHSKEKFYNNNPFIYNVACDAHDCIPVDIDKAIEEMRNFYDSQSV